MTHQRRRIKVQTTSEEKLAYITLNRRRERQTERLNKSNSCTTVYRTVAVNIGGENLYSGVGDEKHFQI